MIEILPGLYAVDLLEYLYISSIAGGFATGQKTPRGWGGVIHRRGTFSVWAACLIVQHFSTHHSGNLMSSLHLDISNMIFHMTIPKLLVNWRQNCGKRRVSFQPLWQEVLLSFQIFPLLLLSQSQLWAVETAKPWDRSSPVPIANSHSLCQHSGCSGWGSTWDKHLCFRALDVRNFGCQVIIQVSQLPPFFKLSNNLKGSKPREYSKFHLRLQRLKL